MMPLNQKENALLKDLLEQEQVCIEKYNRGAAQACDPQLKGLFMQLAQTETTHKQTIEGLQKGVLPNMNGGEASVGETFSASGCDTKGRDCDRYLCADALAMEKHVSSEYDTCIFEFRDPAVRDTLNHIQKEEQKHGEALYKYMAANGMYC